MTLWTPGDRALCLAQRGWRFGGEAHPGPRRCALVVVVRVGLAKVSGSVLLEFEGHRGLWFPTDRFVRLAAHAPDAEDRNTLNVMRSLARMPLSSVRLLLERDGKKPNGKRPA